MKYRNTLAKQASRLLIEENVTIISDDCWGGQFYKQLAIPYRSPNAGLWIRTSDYLNFIQNIKAKDATQIIEQKGCDYPLGITPYANIHFLHYDNFKTASETFIRRFKRINWENIVYKVDFEKPYSSNNDIKTWNEMKLKNSVAFYSNKVLREWGSNIHNGIYIDNWSEDGADMFDISRRYFDIYHWLSRGKIKNSLTYKVLNFLLLDPSTPTRLKRLVLKRNLK